MSGRTSGFRLGGARRAAAAAVISALALGCPPRAPEPPEPPPPPAAPRLVLVIVADQFQGGFLERFAPLWRGGLRRLLDEGAVFTDAHHRHAVTHTSSGYASLATGCHPRRHGVIANYWVDPLEGERVYSVADPEHDISPARLREPTLGDRLKERWPRSRVYAASGKDRSAVLLAGRRADAAFWYDEGEWRSSGYYRGAEPAWLEEFNGLALADSQLGVAWQPLPVPPEELAAAGVRPFDLGPLVPGFPHVFGGLTLAPSEAFYRALRASPWLDEYLTWFAERLIVEEGLGADRWPDLLGLGYSALDSVGHTFGPDSPEVADMLLRLDRTLGELLELVDRRIGLERVVVAFSSDHGVAPLPELGGGGRRMTAADALCLQRVNGRLAERFGDGRWLLPGPFVNLEAAAARGVERDAVEAEAARRIAECPPVRRVWRRGELLDAAAAEPEVQPFVNAFHPERSPDLLIQFEPLFAGGMTAANHGSAWPYDTHVPLVFLGPGLGPLRDGAPVASVDLAPTLAALAGLDPAPVDGTDLGPGLRRAP